MDPGNQARRQVVTFSSCIHELLKLIQGLTAAELPEVISVEKPLLYIVGMYPI